MVRNDSGELISARRELCPDDRSILNVKELDLFDEKTFPGYRRLHEICVQADVRISDAVKFLGVANIGFYFDRPYKDSSDAYFFAPKNPIARKKTALIQPTLPGL